MSTIFSHPALQDQTNQAVLAVVAAVTILTLVGLAISWRLPNRPAMRHSMLLSALLCILASPLLGLVFVSSDASVLTVMLTTEPNGQSERISPAAIDHQVVDEVTTVPRPTEPKVNIVEEETSDQDQGSLQRLSVPQVSVPQVSVPQELLSSAEIVSQESESSELISQSDTLTQVAPPQIFSVEEASIAGLFPVARSPMFYLAWGWSLGTCLLLLGCVRSWWRLRNLTADFRPASQAQSLWSELLHEFSLQRTPQVVTSKSVAVPIVMGWRKPVIVLPFQSETILTADELRDVLIHETAHIVRHDMIVVWMQLIAKAIFWPIVPVHLLNRQLSRAREEVCDNYVLARTDAISYGETLLRLAQRSRGMPMPATVGILHWQGELEKRIRGLLSEARSRSTKSSRTGTIAILSFFCAVSVLICGTSVGVAQPESPQRQTANTDDESNNSPQSVPLEPIPLVLGKVETSTGAPAVGAKVWLVGGDYGNPITLGETTTDETGHFEFTDLPPENEVFNRASYMSVWAQSESGQIGYFNGMYRHRRRPVTVRVTETMVSEGQFVDQEGQPIQGISLTPNTIQHHQLGHSGSDYGHLPPEMSEQFTVTTDLNGKFSIAQLPASGATTLKVTNKRFGELNVSYNLGKPVTIKLNSPVPFTCRIAGPPGTEFPELPAGKQFGKVTANMHLRRNSEGEPVSDLNGAAYLLNYSTEATISPDGRFRLNHFPPESCSVYVALAPEVPLWISQQKTIAVPKEKSKEEVILNAEKAFRISGQVKGLVDGKPVPNATITSYQIVDGIRSYSHQVTTDQNGRYVVHVQPGRYQLQVVKCPVQYISIKRRISVDGIVWNC